VIALALACASTLVLATPVQAASNGRSGDTGGGPASPSAGTILGEPQQTKDRTELAKLYIAARDSTGGMAVANNSTDSKIASATGGSAWDAYNQALADYESAYQDNFTVLSPTAGTASVAGPAIVMSTAATYKTLAVTWVQQQTDYYCGPATAYMILKYRGFSTSAYAGESVSQNNLAGASYLKTNSQGLTTTWPYSESGYFINDMSRGLNRWTIGTLTGGYSIDQLGSSAELQNIVGYSIDASRPFAVSTYEAKNAPHYNKHPLTHEIGHWAVVYGYESSGATTKVADPASGRVNYTNSAQKFYISTASLYAYGAGRYSVW